MADLNNSKLNEYRDMLDHIDKDIVKLIEKRMGISRAVGELKASLALPVLDAAREQEILEKRVSMLSDASLSPYATDIFKTVMECSRRLQSGITAKNNIAYQGIPGGYGALAAEKHFGAGANMTGYTQFDEVLKSVASGEASFGVIPVENSSTGTVNEVLDILVPNKCSIVGEIILPISHCLLGVPGAAMGTIKTVYSHQQALSQCAALFLAHPKWKRVVLANTAEAAKYVAELDSKEDAAIASLQAAENYGLEVLAKGVQDQSTNHTRFIIVSQAPRYGDDCDKLSVRLTLTHEHGTLNRDLSTLASAGISMTSIVSRPFPGRVWQYYFYVDMMANLKKDAEVLKALEESCSDYIVLGNYPACKAEN